MKKATCNVSVCSKIYIRKKKEIYKLNDSDAYKVFLFF